MKQIGKYKILKQLGAGGFGAVYLAEDSKLGVQVAIKVFQVKDDNLARQATSASTDAEGVLKNRFLEEAKILHQLGSNQNIVNIREYDELPDGTPYYVMPYLPKSLVDEIGKDAFTRGALEDTDAELKPRKLGSARAIDIIIQVLKAVSAVHKSGLVHRDIKPANILFDAEGNVQLCDFGIAKLPDTEHSQSGIGMGSRNYMSPEQRESAKHVASQSDVYSIGVLAYRMLTGQIPSFPFSPPIDFTPEIGKPLNDLIIRAISQDELQRPANGSEFLSEFNHAIKQMDSDAVIEDEETGTWVGGESSQIKTELKPLSDKIEKLLLSQGEITDNDLIALEALADIGGLDEEGLNGLIAEREQTLAPKIRPIQNWFKSILKHKGKSKLDKVVEDALTEAGKSIGLTDEQIKSHLRRKLPGCQLGWGQTQLSPPKAETTTQQVTVDSDPSIDQSLIKEVQNRLKQLGFTVSISGVLDTRTKLEIKAFEKSRKLSETGDIDELLLEQLNKAIAEQDDDAFNKAKEKNSVEAYSSYQKSWPDGRSFSKADEAAWKLTEQQAKEKQNPNLYDVYKKHFTNEGENSDKAKKQQIDELKAKAKKGKQLTISFTAAVIVLVSSLYLYDQSQIDDWAWDSAKIANTPGAYQKFIKDYNESEYKSFAESAYRQLDEAAWSRAKKSNSEESYQEYLGQFAQGNYQTEASSRYSKLKKSREDREAKLTRGDSLVKEISREQSHQKDNKIEVVSPINKRNRFRDDFSGNLNAWIKYADSNWYIDNGKLIGSYSLSCGSKQCSQADIVLDDKYQISGNWTASVDFTRTVDPSHSDHFQSIGDFVLWVNKNKKIHLYVGGAGWDNWGGTQANVKVGIKKWNGSWSNIISKSVPISWNTESWHNAKLSKSGKTYTLYFDDILVYTFEDNYLNGQGKIGLHTYGNKILDNFLLE